MKTMASGLDVEDDSGSMLRSKYGSVVIYLLRFDPTILPINLHVSYHKPQQCYTNNFDGISRSEIGAFR